MTVMVNKTLDRHLRILASAGAGKTYQLSNRYLTLLAAGEKPGAILATTFTRPAAGEIRDRILRRLAEAATDDDQRQALEAGIGRSVTTEQAVAMLRRITDDLPRLHIRTLDSFFNMVAHAFGPELGIAPDSRIVDEAELIPLRGEAIRRMLEAGESDQLIELMRRLTQGSVGGRITGVIDRTVESHYEVFRESEREAWSCIPLIDGELDRDTLDNAITRLASVTVTGKRLTDAVDKSIWQARSRDWPALLKGGPAAKVAEGDPTYYRAALPTDLVDAYTPIVNHAAAVLVNRWRDHTMATYDLLDAFHTHFEAVKRERRVITFSDLTEAMVRAVSTTTPEDIYFRLDGMIQHMLLDEFQDTSARQWHGLRPMASEIVSHMPPERSFFCVGDVKQSIYEWRDAEPDILDRLGDLLAGPSGQSPLDDDQLIRSYRSSQVIIDTVNRAFGGLGESSAMTTYRQAADDWGRWFTPHETARTELTGYAEMTVFRRTGKDAEDSRVTAAGELAARLHARAPDKTIGILTRSNKMAGRILYELGPTRLDLPAAGSGGGALTDAAAVNALLDALRLADHPGDTVSAFNVAHSPLAATLDIDASTMTGRKSTGTREKLARRIRRQLSALGYGGLLGQWVEAIAGDADERETLRLNELLELADLFDQRPTSRPGDFVRLVEAWKPRDGLAAPVQVMTIHKSKGLEFDIVILPDLETTLSQGRSDVVVERDGPAGPITKAVRRVDEVVRGFVPPLKQLFLDDRESRVSEALCLLYVAMTRARRGLYTFVDAISKTPGKRPSRILIDTLAGGHGSPGVVYRHGDEAWLDEPSETTTPATNDDQTLGGRIQFAGTPTTRPGMAAAAASRDRSARLAQQLVIPNVEAREVGLAIHALFEQVQWLTDVAPGRADLVATLEHTLPHRPKRWLTAQADRFRSLIKQDEVRQLLTRPPAAHVDVHPEYPFARRVDGAVQRGFIDRVEITRTEDGGVKSARVIDFKTDEVMPLQASDHAEVYRPQLETYRDVVAEAFGLDAADVTMLLLFVIPGVTVQL